METVLSIFDEICWILITSFLRNNEMGKKKKKQEAGDDLGVCVRNLFHKAITRPSLVAIGLVKVEM